MPDITFENKYREYVDTINRELSMRLENYIASGDPESGRIYEAMRYSLLSGGKRVRAAMLLAFSEMCGGSRALALPFAVGVEAVHTYSLIHDDLPCMDDDDLRRGMPTSHRRFGEATAVLAGDALLNFAFEHVLDSAGLYGNSEPYIRALGVLAGASGAKGMISGQQMDIQNEGNAALTEKPVSEALVTLNLTADRKTGAMFSAACRIGVIIAEGSKAQTTAAGMYGIHIGRAFQIRDDILNVSGDSEKLGKATGSDGGRGKATYAGVLGSEESERFLHALTNLALGQLDGFEHSGFIRELSAFLLDRDY